MDVLLDRGPESALFPRGNRRFRVGAEEDAVHEYEQNADDEESFR
jgi:hypothetical protein